MRDKTTKIRIKIDTQKKIKNLADKMGLKQVTVLEYLLEGKIDISKL